MPDRWQGSGSGLSFCYGGFVRPRVGLARIFSFSLSGGLLVTFSGILVHAAPGHFDSLVTRLRTLPGTEVHQQDRDNGRLVVTLEAPTVDDEIDGLRRIQKEPGVLSASLVYHRLGAEAPAAEAETATHQGESG